MVLDRDLYPEPWPEAWLDPTTRRGLLGGLLHVVQAGVIFALLFVLAAMTGTIGSFETTPGPLVTVLGLVTFLVGLARVARLHANGPPAWMRVVGWRALAWTGYAVAVGTLLVTVPGPAVVAAVAYLCGRLIGHLAVFLVG